MIHWRIFSAYWSINMKGQFQPRTTFSAVEMHGIVRERIQAGNPHRDCYSVFALQMCALHSNKTQVLSVPAPGLAKSLARRPGSIVFSSRATKMYHHPARRATLNTGILRNVPSNFCVRAAHYFFCTAAVVEVCGRAEEIMCRPHAKISWESHLIECQ